MTKLDPPSTAKFCKMILIFKNFPSILSICILMENCETYEFLLQVACVSGAILIFPKPGFWQIGVFTKYRCFNAPNRPQMPQKWIRTIPFGSGHTLGTLNHGLGPLFCCFITLFGAGGTIDQSIARILNPGNSRENQLDFFSLDHEKWFSISRSRPETRDWKKKFSFSSRKMRFSFKFFNKSRCIILRKI